MQQEVKLSESGKTKRANIFLAISIVADIATVVGLLFETRQFLLLLGAALAIGFGILFLFADHRRARHVKLAIAAACVALGAVLATIAVLQSSSPEADSIVGQGSVNGTTTTAPGTANATPPATPQPGLIFDGEVKLEYKQGADLEHGPKTGLIEGAFAEGVNGEIDLYLDFVGLFRTQHGGLYNYSGLERDAAKKLV